MKFEIDRDQFARALAQTDRAVATRSSLPILGAIMLEVTGDRLQLAATNLEIGIVRAIDCTAYEEGKVAVTADALVKLIKAFPAKSLVAAELDRKNFTLKVKCGRNRAALRCLDGDDFPVVERPEATPIATIAPDVLRRAIDGAAFAAAQDESRPLLAGLHFRFNGDRLTLSAADGHRMAVTFAELATPVAAELALTAPAKVMQELAKLLAVTAEPVEILTPPNRGVLIFRADGLYVSSRVIEGSYPDYRQIAPTGYSTRLVAPRDTLRDALAAAVTLAPRDEPYVRLYFDPAFEGDEGGALKITARNTDLGENEADVDAVVTGQDLTIACNARYLTGALTALGTQRAALELTGKMGAFAVKPVGDESALHIVMPMHENGDR